jgi:hypothetical protein
MNLATAALLLLLLSTRCALRYRALLRAERDADRNYRQVTRRN